MVTWSLVTKKDNDYRSLGSLGDLGDQVRCGNRRDQPEISTWSRYEQQLLTITHHFLTSSWSGDVFVWWDKALVIKKP